MKNKNIILVFSVLAILIGTFLFLEYKLTLKELDTKKQLDLKRTFKTVISKYKTLVEYEKINIDTTNLKNYLNQQNKKQLKTFIDKNFNKLLKNDFSFINFYDKNSNLIYSYDEKLKNNSINPVEIDFNVDMNDAKYQIFLLEKENIFSFKYPLYDKADSNKLLGYVDIGLNINKLLNDIYFLQKVDKTNIALSKRFLNKNNINFKENNKFIYNNTYYELVDLTYFYNNKEDLNSLKNEFNKEYLYNDFFTINFIGLNEISNQILFQKLKTKDGNTIGYLVLHTFDDSYNKLIGNEVLKFIIFVFLIYILYVFYRKNEESDYTAKQLFDAIIESSIVSKSDKKGKIIFVNDNFSKISGYSKEELLNQKHSIVRHEDMSKEFFRRLWKRIKDKRIFSGVIKNRRKDGSAYYVNSTIFPLVDTSGNIKEYMAIRYDIGDIISPQKQILEDVKCFDNPCVITLKIDEYETYRNIYPTSLLSSLEQILHEEIINLKPMNFNIEKVYMLGDGEYGIIFDRDKSTLEDIYIFVKKFIQNLDNYNIKVDEYDYSFTFIAAFTTEENSLFENQRIAIKSMISNEIKEKIVCSNGFASNLQEASKKNLETVKMIEDAIVNKKLVSFFQPIYNIKEKKIEKYESLVRIIDGDRIISPFFFMDVAKTSSLHKKITLIILENTFSVLDKIKEGVTINLSAIDIEDIDIRNALLNYFTKPEYYGRITFEFLEDEKIKDFNLIKDFVSLAKIMGGVQLAIDDFGSGYSNYERIVDIQPDILKIDGSLIKDIANNKSNQNIVKSIVNFAKNENIKTVAEFVADEETMNVVTELDIDFAQGFFIGKPGDLSNNLIKS